MIRQERKRVRFEVTRDTALVPRAGIEPATFRSSV